MPKRFLKFAISVMWFFCIGIPSLNATDILDSNCEALSYQSTWPNYSKWSKGNYTTKYLLWGTSISCRKKYKDSCVAIRSDNTVSLTWSDLSDYKGEIRTFWSQKKDDKYVYPQYVADYNALKAFRTAVDSGKIVVRSASDDRYMVKDPTDTATRAILSKIQNHPTSTMFNWDVILDAYKYIVDQVNSGLADDIKNNRTYSATIVRNPKDMTFGEKTACAKIQKLFDAYKKYGQKVAITEADFNGCFAYQAYCTENFAMSGTTRDVQKLLDTYNHCQNVLKPESIYDEASKKKCKERLDEGYATINNNLSYLDNVISAFNSTMAKQSPATLEYFEDLRKKYQKVANDMSALIEETKADLKAELINQQNYNKLAIVGEACLKVMGDGDDDNTYTQALKNYVSAYPVAASYNGVSSDSVKTNAQVRAEFDDFLKSTESGPSAWGTTQTSSLIKACNGISDLAVKKITEAKKKHEAAKLASVDEYEVVAKVWNKTVNQINTICNSKTYTEEYEGDDPYQAVYADMVREDQEEYSRTTGVAESTGYIPSNAAILEQQCQESPLSKLLPEELKVAEDLFNGLFAPVIEYEKDDGTKAYIANPIPRLVASETFAKSTGMDEIMSSSFKAVCENAHVMHFKRSENYKRVFKSAVTGMSLLMSDGEVAANMKTAIDQIKKDKAEICAYEENEVSSQVVSQDGITITTNTKNDDRVDLMAKYISLTPGLFQEYISQNPDPVACSILSAAYDNEEFNDVIKPVLGAANIALLIGSFIPYTAIPCRVGLVVISVVDGVVTMNNIFDQLNTMEFVDMAVNSGMVSYQTGDAIEGDINNAMFWNYVSLTADALILFQAAKGFKIAKTVAKETSAAETVVNAVDDIPSVYPINEVGQVAPIGNSTITATQFRLPAVIQSFKSALARFLGGMMIYANSLAGITVNALPKTVVATEQVITISTNAAETFFVGASKVSTLEAGAFLSKLGMAETQISNFTNLLSSTSSTIAAKSTMISGNFISQVAPMVIGSGAGAVVGYQVTTLIGDYSYINYFYNQDGITQRYSQISLSSDKNIPNTEGGLGGGTPVDPTLQAELDNAISDYNKYCIDITGII